MVWYWREGLWSETHSRKKYWMVSVKENEVEGLVWDSNRELHGGEQNPISISRCLRNQVICGLGCCVQWSEGQACVTMLRNVCTVCANSQESPCYGSWRGVSGGWELCHHPAGKAIETQAQERSDNVRSPEASADSAERSHFGIFGCYHPSKQTHLKHRLEPGHWKASSITSLYYTRPEQCCDIQWIHQGSASAYTPLIANSRMCRCVALTEGRKRIGAALMWRAVRLWVHCLLEDTG